MSGTGSGFRGGSGILSTNRIDPGAPMALPLPVASPDQFLVARGKILGLVDAGLVITTAAAPPPTGLNVLGAGAPLDGTDASVAINAAIAQVNAAGGGAVLIPNTGVPYMLAHPVVPLSGVSILGIGQPILKLLPGSNCAVVESLSFQGAFGTQGSGGVVRSVIEGLTLDGNSANQSTVQPDFQNGVSFFGPGPKMRRVFVQNTIGHGFVFDWGSGNPQSNGVVEGVLEDLYVHFAGRTGMWFIGAHDTSISNIIVRAASQSSDGTFGSFLLAPGGSLRANNIHGYNDPTVPQTSYALISAGYVEIANSHLEGSHQSTLLTGPLGKFTNSLFYNSHVPPAGKALLDLQASNCSFMGCWFGGTPGANMYAVAFGAAGVPAAGNILLGCIFQEFDVNGPFNFVNDGGKNLILSRGATTSTSGATAFTGTPAADTSINYYQSGTRISYVSPITAGDVAHVVGNSLTMQGAATGAPVGLAANGLDVNVSLFLAPKGQGALTAAMPDSTTLGGNPRGLNAIDLQTTRALATDVASGFAAVLAGGRDNTAAGNYSVVAGGRSNTADAGFSEAGGQNAHTHNRQGSRVWASGSILGLGDSQKGWQPLRAVTTSATAVNATSDQNPAVGYNSLYLQPNSAMVVRLRAIARDYFSGAAAIFTTADLLVTCGATISTVALAAGASVAMTLASSTGTVTGWGVTVSVDGTTAGFLIACTGAAGRTVHWSVDPEFVEVV